MKKPTTLIIMDGYGLAAPSASNAISCAVTPNLDGFFKNCPNTILMASGMDVGLPEGQMGNSEVGHTNIGAGRIVLQELPKITNDIKNGEFYKNKAYVEAMELCKASGKSLHLMGLLSSGGVHSHYTHMWAFLEMAKRQGLKNVYLHCFTDGRDNSPHSGKEFIKECIAKCTEIGVGKIATIVGRFYAMDRDNRWARVETAYNAMVFGDGTENPDPVKAMQYSYDNGVTDEFIKPIICNADGLIRTGDSVIFTNYRPDRAREITRTFVDPAFNGFTRKSGYFPVHFVCTTQYDEKMPNVTVAYPPEHLKNTFGDVISRLGLKQLRIAETEKYAHVTFFFNGGAERIYSGEDRMLILSPKEFPTYDRIPKMSAYEVTREVCKSIRLNKYDVIILNYANCDMVGHTGKFEAAVKAVEAVDDCVGQVVKATLDKGGVALITSDHGNADKMLDLDGITPFTPHTENPVPFIVVGADVKLRPGRLADIAPTMLDLMGIEKPAEMTGTSLIVK